MKQPPFYSNDHYLIKTHSAKNVTQKDKKSVIISMNIRMKQKGSYL